MQLTPIELHADGAQDDLNPNRDHPHPEHEGNAMKINRVRRPIPVAVAALSLSSPGVTLTSQPASATAYGCVQYGSVFTIKGVGIRKGTFCYEVNGSGMHVNYVCTPRRLSTTHCSARPATTGSTGR